MLVSLPHGLNMQIWSSGHLKLTIDGVSTWRSPVSTRFLCASWKTETLEFYFPFVPFSPVTVNFGDDDSSFGYVLN